MIILLRVLPTTFFSVCALFTVLKYAYADWLTAVNKEAVEVLVKQWAPLVWLAPKEQFLPLDVNEFLRNVHVREQENLDIQRQLNNLMNGSPLKHGQKMENSSTILRHDPFNKLPYGEISKKSYLVTNNEIDELLYNSSSFIYGKNPNKFPVPIYAVVKVCDSSEEDLDYTNLQFTVENRQPFIPITIPKNVEQTNGLSPNIESSILYFSNTRQKRSTQDEAKGKETNEFMANVADNVKFTTDDIENSILLNSVNTHKTSGDIPSFHVTYWMFYPYSQGKTMCTMNLGPLGRIPIPIIFGMCMGSRKDFGSHVGDWEHMSLYFTGISEPEAMYVSAHDVGAYYSYNRLTGTFEFKSQETRKGILQHPNFPKTVITSYNHPVLFAALGSHGLWTAPGKHRFVRVPRLYDINGFGTPWYTWKSVDITYENLRSQRSLAANWLDFKGKWGNPKSKCHPLRRIGLNFCEFTDGPTGIPLKPAHFQCKF